MVYVFAGWTCFLFGVSKCGASTPQIGCTRACGTLGCALCPLCMTVSEYYRDRAHSSTLISYRVVRYSIRIQARIH